MSPGGVSKQRRSRRAAVVLAALSLCLLACESRAGGQDAGPASPKKVVTDVTAKDYEMPPLPRATVTLHDAFGGAHQVSVEVAADGKSRERGLMWRQSLKDGEGMLFIFPVEEVSNFWMRNTLIPLDMIFINADGKIVGIVENAEPKTLTARTVGVPGKYVLEVPGGYSAKVGIKPGSVAEFRGTQMVQVKD